MPVRLDKLVLLTDALALGVFLPGVELNPSSLRRASDVSGSARLDLAGLMLGPKLFMEEEVANAVVFATAPKLFIEPEPRRNWLIDALEGLGGRCEKSLGAKCLRMSCELFGLAFALGVLCGGVFRLSLRVMGSMLEKYGLSATICFCSKICDCRDWRRA